MTDTLQDQMLRVAKGDQNAFRHLVQAMSPGMYRLSLRLMSGQTAAAEDALQDALIKLWVTAPRWQPSGRVEGYLARLVYTACMDQHRRARPTVLVDEDMPDLQPRIDDALEQRARSAVLMTAIADLPEKQQNAILLTYFGSHSNRAVAGMMNTSEKAVESLLVRARKTLAMTLPADLKEDLI